MIDDGENATPPVKDILPQQVLLEGWVVVSEDPYY
jgi:hypothetical protein